MTNSSLSQDDFVKQRDDLCDDDTRTLIEMTRQQFKDMRDERKNHFHDKYKDIISYYKDGSVGSLFNAFLPFAILLGLWMVVVIISLVFFVFLCLGKYRKEDIDDRTFTIFACITFAIFIFLFIAFFIFIGLSLKSFFSMACSLYDIPSTLIVGINTTEDKFLGLTNFKTIFEHFREEIDKADTVNLSFDSIFFRNTPTGTNQAWQQLRDFVDKYSETKIENSTGSKSTPITVMTMTPGISDKIETQFLIADLTAERIQIAAEKGRHFQNRPDRIALKQVITEAQKNSEEIKILMQELFNPFSSSANEAYNFSSLGFIIMTIVGLVIVGFFAAILITICSWCLNDKCEGCLFPSKVFLVIATVLILLFSFLAFIVMMGSVSISAFCGFTGQINDGNFTVFEELEGLDVDKRIIDAFKFCSTDQLNGDLRSIFIEGEQYETYEGFVSFMDGISAYQVYLDHLESHRNVDQIAKQQKIWEEYRNGTRVDFKQVNTTLSALNDLIECDGQVFKISIVECGGVKACKSIEETENYFSPDCSDDPDSANTYFRNLKNYYTDEVELINLMISDLIAEDRPSPKNFFHRSEEELMNIKSDFDSIKDRFALVAGDVSEYDTNFREIIDCRVLRKQFLRFEQETCFRFGYYIYIILVISTLCCVFMLASAWFAFCALRSEGNYEEPSFESDDGKDVYKDDFDMQDFEEEEIIPNF